MRVSRGSVAAGILLLLLAAFAWRNISDIDVGLHMATGRWIVQHGWVPDRDPFTYTLGHRAYLAYHWLFQVGVHEIHRAFGEYGLTLARWMILLGTGLLIADVFRVRRCSALAGAVVGICAILAIEHRFRLRPEIVGYLLAAATLAVLERRRQGRAAPLWLIPVLQVLWVNTHVYVLGWAILLAYLGDEVIRRRSLRTPTAAWTSVAFLALFLNPYHVHGVLKPFSLAALARSPIYAQRIGELASPFTAFDPQQPLAANLHLDAYFLLLALAVIAIPVHLAKRRWADVALLASFGVLSTLALRNVALFAVVTGPSLCVALNDLSPAHAGGRLRRVLSETAFAAVLGFAALTAFRVMSGAYYVQQETPFRVRSGFCRVCLATDAADWVTDHGLRGNGFNNFNIGGTLMWRAPGHRVFIDGRFDVPDEAFFRRYLAVVHPKWWSLTQREYEIEYVVLAHYDDVKLTMVQMLWSDPAWKMVFVDGAAVIFVRADGPNGSLPLARVPEQIGDAARMRTLQRIRVDASAWARIRRWIWWSEPSVDEDLRLGTFLMRIGLYDAAEAPLLRAAEASPSSPRTHQNLGLSYIARGLGGAALVAFRNLRALDPENPVLSLIPEASHRKLRRQKGTPQADRAPGLNASGAPR